MLKDSSFACRDFSYSKSTISVLILAYHSRSRESTKHDNNKDEEEEAEDHHHDHDDNRTQHNPTQPNTTPPTMTTTNARICKNSCNYLPTNERKKTFQTLTSLFIKGPPSKQSPWLSPSPASRVLPPNGLGEEPLFCGVAICSRLWKFVTIRMDKMNTNNPRWLPNSLKILQTTCFQNFPKERGNEKCDLKIVKFGFGEVGGFNTVWMDGNSFWTINKPTFPTTCEIKYDLKHVQTITWSVRMKENDIRLMWKMDDP